MPADGTAPPAQDALTLDAQVPERVESRRPSTWEADGHQHARRAGHDDLPVRADRSRWSLESGGTEAYRYSDGRGFTEALMCRDLAPGATATFSVEEDQGLAVDPGTYDVRVDLVADRGRSRSRRRSPSSRPTEALSTLGRQRAAQVGAQFDHPVDAPDEEVVGARLIDLDRVFGHDVDRRRRPLAAG